MGVNPFDSAALGRLIERVVDSGFTIKEKMNDHLSGQPNLKHHFCTASIKTGVPFSQIIKHFLGKTYPVF